MRNRSLSGWRQFVLYAVVVSFALTPVFAGGKDRVTSAVGNPQTTGGLQQVDDSSQPTADNLEPAKLYARSNYLWPYGISTPYGAVSRDQLNDQGILRTMVGTLQIANLQVRLPAELQTANKLDVLGMQYFIVDLNHAWLRDGGAAKISDVIAAAGGEVVGGMPVSAVIARLTQGALTEVQAQPGVNAVVAFPSALKLHPSIGQLALADPIKAVSEVYSLDITIFPGENGRAVASQIIALGGEVTVVAGNTIRASLHRSKLGQLADIQAVATIYEAYPNSPFGEETTITMQTGGFQGRGAIGPYHLAGVNGSGNGVAGTTTQVLLVIDNGAQLDGADLADTDALAGTASSSHRKVVAYRPASDFSGTGDGLGCDAPAQGGTTHGHVVAAIAVGNATNIVDLSTGWNSSVSFQATDQNNLDWTLDGVAPGAKVSILDATVTPAAASCDDPVLNDITLGPNYYTGTDLAEACPGALCPGFLQVAYRDDGARVTNMSFGSNANVYQSEARQIDQFLYDKGDAMVFAASGDGGEDFDNDGRLDLRSVASPSTNRNGISVGRTGNASLFDDAERRFFTSSVGPATTIGVGWETDPANSLDRVQPLIMAPGGDSRAALGKPSEYACRTNDNDQNDPVECDTTEGNVGTSFASPAAAGAALLMRDYFAQGHYPTGAQITANAVPNISGALVKALIVASADFLNGGFVGAVANQGIVPLAYRFNNEQGYGRVQLDNVLPLQTWAASVTGLIVADGGIPGGANNLSGLDGVLNGTVAGETDSQTFEVCAPNSTLRVALAWMDRPDAAGLDGGAINTDLDLELVAPDGTTVYYGNYFTDDDNRDFLIDATTEDCPGIKGLSGNRDESEWSLPICQRGDTTLSPHDVANNTEGIFLSDDYDRDGSAATDPDNESDLDHADDNQIQIGTWTIRVKVKDTKPDGTAFTPSPNADSAQRYAVVIAGAGCLGSSVRFDASSYVCNGEAVVTVNDLPGHADPEWTISADTTLEVIDSLGAVVDTETGPSFTRIGTSESFQTDKLFLSDQTARADSNGVLDVRDGDTLRVTYNDVVHGNVEISEASVDCQLRIASGAIVFAQFGFDTGTFVNGGCERNARGLFEFGFPDRYLDEDEQMILGVAIGSQETETITNVIAALRCVEVNDALAPADCLPGTTNCLNPNRLITGPNAMTPCPSSDLVISNTPITIGQLPTNAAIGINYNVQMGPVITDMKEVEFVLELTSPTSGRSGTSTSVFRNTLDADVLAVLYSTDFPTGGTEFADWNNNELLEGNSTLNPGDPGFTPPSDDANTGAGRRSPDYRFETRVFSDMTAGGKNAAAAATAPWNFDSNDGGFTNGIGAQTDDAAIIDTIAQWGEDKNFNNILDGACALGHCINDATVLCTSDSACTGAAGTTCIFDAQGWCGGVVGGTQCNGIDDPGDPDLDPEDCEGDINGNTCDIVFCQDNPAACILATLSGLLRCISEGEDIDPTNFGLDNVWNTDGGCGWQTAIAGTCDPSGNTCYIDADCPGAEPCSLTAPSRGMWHTGRIGPFGASDCLGAGNNIDQCQGIETVGGADGELLWFELLKTPPMQKVDDTADSVNILNFSWNQAVDLEDRNALWSWEIDTDTNTINPVDLTSDLAFLGSLFGGFTPRGGSTGLAQNNPDLTNGFSLFAPLAGVDNVSTNGTLGGNRHGQNACYFEGIGVYDLLTLDEFGLAGPFDDDLNNGHCPGDRNRFCTAFCDGGDNSGEPCNLVGGGIDCTAGGGACSITSTNPTNNRCEVTDTCVSTVCAISGATCAADVDCRSCVFANSTIDEYVFPNGPIRNMDMTAVNGPDLRFNTVEDLVGETGTDFQAGIGIVNFEKEDTSAPDPAFSYGIGVDDVLFEWQELTLVPDATDCSTSGACATIDSSVGTSFQSATFLDITVLDTSPSNNDCNDDGNNTSTGDDTDCDNNGVADVRVLGKSEDEPLGERVTLNCVNPSGSTCPDGEYAGSLPVSATYDSPGVVFVQSQGAVNPTIEMNYFDFDDGTGQICQNSLLASANGLVQAFTQITLTGGNVALIDSFTTDNGDGDIWADTNETIDLFITLRNQTGGVLNNVQARLASNDPKVECILNAAINIGTMLPDDPNTVGIDEGVVTSTGAFTFRIASSANRVGECSISLAACSQDADCVGGAGDECDAELRDYSAALNVFISSDEFDTAAFVQTTTIPLDLDAFGGGTPTEIVEGFEAGFGIFGINNMDSFDVVPGGGAAGIPGSGGHGGSLANSDGYRCAFADPDYINAFTYNDDNCHMGININHANDVWWTVIADNKKAFSGNQSVAWTFDQGPTLEWTTPTGAMEALETISPLALGFKDICSNAPTTACPNGDVDCPGGSCVQAQPKITWKHQISFMDFRGVNAGGPFRSADGGVIHLQLANPLNDNAVGDWIKVDTVSNQYDSQRQDNFNVCTFDPIDDGNDEDDFFDPADPFRRYGPSSTCFPEFVYTYMGDTDGAFDPVAGLGNATTGPGLEGTQGPGTWVESVVDLKRFRAQYVRLRYLASAIQIDFTWQDAFTYEVSDPRDDGWFIDDFRVSDAITSAALLEGDVKVNASVCSGDGTTACVDDTDCTVAGGTCLFPGCGVACNAITASLTTDPTVPLAAPGRVVELSTLDSSADRCVGGVLQYRFWIDENNNGGSFEMGTDTLLRNWSENALLLEAPSNVTNYAADTRCSTLLGCTNTAYNTVLVECPFGNFPTVTANGTVAKSAFQWAGGAIAYAFAEGPLATLGPTYPQTPGVGGVGFFGAGHILASVPNNDIWVLFRSDAPAGGAFCNSGGRGPYDSGGASGRDLAPSTLP